MNRNENIAAKREIVYYEQYLTIFSKSVADAFKYGKWFRIF